MPLDTIRKRLYQISIFDDGYPKALENAIIDALDGTAADGTTAHWQRSYPSPSDETTEVTHLVMEFEITGTKNCESEVQTILAATSAVTAICPAARIRVATGGDYQNMARPYVLHFPIGAFPTRTH